MANGALHELIDNGFIHLNATAIRRLLDRSATSGRKGVYSLYGVLQDIKADVGLITRADSLEARGLAYDFEQIKREAYEKARASGANSYFVSRAGWADAEYWHGVMDELSGVTADKRGPSDAPNEGKLDWLLDELKKHGSDVQDWVDKFIAHASSPESRQTLPPEHQSLTLAKLWRAERVLLRVADFISRCFIDGASLGGVPIPQFDQFAFLEQPFADPAALDAMRHAWDQHCKETGACQGWNWDSPLISEADTWEG